MRLALYLSGILVLAGSASSLLLDVYSNASICAAAKEIVQGQMDYYEGIKYGGTVGMFGFPYYWWHAGEVFGGWVDYWAFCAKDNETFSQILFDAMYAQRGEFNNYMPENQTVTEGNDDQGVWGLALMQAVERNFTNPEDHSWLFFTQALFNTMNNRWNTSTCGGGLKWQIFTYLNGYYYKNSISNGALFSLAARLYRFTGEKFYLDVAEKVWEWMLGIGLIDTSDVVWHLHDGATEGTNCTQFTSWQWSYTYGIFLSGSAYLYNATGERKWKEATLKFANASSYFFNGTIMTETTCSTVGRCNNDQRSFRSLFSRGLGLTAALIPQIRNRILNGWLKPSAKAAAQSCSGDARSTCGYNWAADGWDGKWGLGEQMGALEVILSLITSKVVPLTPDTGAYNVGGDVNAGNDTATV
ncbi:hypothetical protein OXX79_001870 [Metschnikowia pulcherrima]